MREPEDLFEKLTGRTPTDEEISRLRRIKDTLRLGNTDAVWSLLIALDHYLALYKEIPERIKKAGDREVARIREAAEAVMAEEARKAHHSLANAVVASARQAAGHRAWAAMWQAAAWAFVAAAFLISIPVWVIWPAALSIGEESGYSRGYEDGLGAVLGDMPSDERPNRILGSDEELWGWMLSEEGKMAQELAKHGLIVPAWAAAKELEWNVAFVSSGDGLLSNWMDKGRNRIWVLLLREVIRQGLLGDFPAKYGCPQAEMDGYRWRLLAETWCDVWNGRIVIRVK